MLQLHLLRCNLLYLRMHPLPVLYKGTGIDEPLTARDTLVWLLSGVDTSMDNQRGVPLELFVAKLALKVLLIRVDQRMAIEAVLVDERFQTDLALVGRSIQVLRLVILESEFLLELLTTVRANVEVLVLAMGIVLVLAKFRLSGEFLAALVTLEQFQCQLVNFRQMLEQHVIQAEFLVANRASVIIGIFLVDWHRLFL